MFQFELFGIQSDGSLHRHKVEGLYPTLQKAIEAAREIASPGGFSLRISRYSDPSKPCKRQDVPSALRRGLKIDRPGCKVHAAISSFLWEPLQRGGSAM